jgi:oligo-1,6-glucosidase/alpha-glucosidase
MQKKLFIITLKLIFGLLLIGLIWVIIVNVHEPKEELPALSPPDPSINNLDHRHWWEGTTVYQIYPRSYQDSNGDGIGDINGIIDRLDYLKQLGIETLWFSPFFDSPQGDYGYDVSDYLKVDGDYGDSTSIDSLIAEVHKRDMKIVFDLVLNHTSEEHPWFVQSRSSKNNPKSDWYVWKDGEIDNPPNNWHNMLGSQGWHYDEGRGQWYFSSFLPFQPDLNWRNPEVKDTMMDILRFWLDKGVDGFRLDIFNCIYEDESLKDNPGTLRYLPTKDLTKVLGQERKYTLNHPDNFTLAMELRTMMDEYEPDRFMVGEVFGDQPTLKKFMGDNNDGLHLVFLFDITEFKWKADFFRERIEKFEAFYPYPYTPTYVFSNHDRIRSITHLDGDLQKAKTLALMQLTLRGVPFIYQGEEIGIPTASIPPEKALDPLPAAFDWIPEVIRKNVPVIYNRDNCRTPMQWDNTAQAGFTGEGVEPWLPVMDNFQTLNVATQLEDSLSLLNNYMSLIRLRNEIAPLKWGSLSLMKDPKDNDVLAYHRSHNEEKVAVFINFSSKEKAIPGNGKVLYSSGSIIEKGEQRLLAPHCGVIIYWP